MPITSLGLAHAASDERVSSGVPALDDMLGAQGYFRGTSVLISGSAGSGKSTLSAHFVDAACARGERCLYLAFEESADQIVRNMRSVGIDLDVWRKRGLLRIESSRPTLHGMEMHLAVMHREINAFRPSIVVVDPMTNFGTAGLTLDAYAMLLRLVDFLKSRGITAVLVSLAPVGSAAESTEIGVSSLIDTWIVLRDWEVGSERRRLLYVLKSRGMPHSNAMREFVIGPNGITLLPCRTPTQP